MSTLPEIAADLRDFALSLPGATEDFPWGERVVKVNKKVFVVLGMSDPTGAAGLAMSVKLPESGEDALTLPYAKPTGYNLGKSGWVSFRFAPGDQPDPTRLRAWVEESWRAVAPKRLVKAYVGG
jgi:predicted DNA-binding protein (MmcQ/YjbR family)